MTEPSWNDLQRKPAPTQETSRLDVLCARIFITADGKELLKELRRKHFDTFAQPFAEEKHLRVRAANQQFVLDLEAACERGLAALSAKKPA